MNVEKFISCNEADRKEEIGIGGLGGFFDDGMRWEDYKNRFSEEQQPLIESLRAYIIQHNIRINGAEHQDDVREGVPLFENGKVATYSYRAWGDLMAAIWSSEENKDYNYMDFYC